MRIVLTWLSTAYGGAEMLMPEIAEQLALLGAQVSVVWWRLGGPSYLGSAERVQLHEATTASGYRAALAAAIGNNAAGTVVISNHRTVPVDLDQAQNVPVLAVAHAILQKGEPLRLVDPGSGELVGQAPEHWPWHLLERAACWVGISAASADSVRAVGPPGLPVTVIHNGVAVPERTPARAERGQLLRVAAVGRPVAWKRLEDIVAAVAHPMLAGRIHLDVYGQSGSAPQRLAAELGLPATFHGWIDDLPRRLARADVLACAALMEGFGRCVIDAAGVSTPAIVPRAGAGPEVVLDGITGYCYDPADPDGLVLALRRAADASPAQLAAVGRAARARALAWFTPGRCAAQYLQLAHETLAAPCQPARRVA
ncbi:glycosyltransferase family 4 protein [Acrocarpospora sp. B8E8]|uniref:glycosyltransferase family 4 protein n=1 Tax=Acrocarpospora sp. B8E8 TaxID=3153572 RepID=UPI00325D4796